jgi:hypothetical protein
MVARVPKYIGLSFLTTLSFCYPYYSQWSVQRLSFFYLRFLVAVVVRLSLLPAPLAGDLSHG